jgi:hypothetical protein
MCFLQALLLLMVSLSSHTFINPCAPLSAWRLEWVLAPPPFKQALYSSSRAFHAPETHLLSGDSAGTSSGHGCPLDPAPLGQLCFSCSTLPVPQVSCAPPAICMTCEYHCKHCAQSPGSLLAEAACPGPSYLSIYSSGCSAPSSQLGHLLYRECCAHSGEESSLGLCPLILVFFLVPSTQMQEGPTPWLEPQEHSLAT